jgi:hypothetical protein
MTLKRAVLVALIGVVLVVGVAQAGWFFQSGRWYYTPDIGSDITLKGIPNPEAQPSRLAWSFTSATYACACHNKGGNFASEVVSVEYPVTVLAVEDIEPTDLIDKKKGIALVSGKIDTALLCKPETLAAAGVTCQNHNWSVDPESALVYVFSAKVEAFLKSKKTGEYESQGSQTYNNCTLSNLAYSPLNPPPGGTPYNCE